MLTVKKNLVVPITSGVLALLGCVLVIYNTNPETAAPVIFFAFYLSALLSFFGLILSLFLVIGTPVYSAYAISGVLSCAFTLLFFLQSKKITPWWVTIPLALALVALCTQQIRKKD